MSDSHSHISSAEKKKRRARRKLLRVLVLLLILAAVLAGGVFVAGVVVTNSSAVYPGVIVGETELGGMTEAEAAEALQGWEQKNRADCEVRILDTIAVTVDAVSTGVYPDAKTAAHTAYEYGRGGSPIQNLVSWLACRVNGADLGELSSDIRENYFSDLVEECEQALNGALGTEPYTISYDTAELIMHKGQGGLQLDADAFRTALQTALLNGEMELRFDNVINTDGMPDFEALHEKLYAEAANAAYTTDGTHEIIPETVGVDFDVYQAEALWLAAGLTEKVSIPLKITEPAVTQAELEALQFHDLLGATTTKYNNSAENRCSNVRLAAKLINDTVLYPGEEFSFNEVVGVRTEEAGFVPAPAFSGYDDIKDEIGGGVCQVSTTLYASTLFSFLEITAHTCHIYPPNYIQLGMDTTVTIPEGGGRTIDFKFVNNKNAPIKIVAYTEETEYANGSPFKTITVEIWGTLEEGDFMPIEFDNSYADVYDYDRTIEPAYEGREGYIIKFTHDETEFEDGTGKGLRTLTHRKVFDSSGRLVQDRIINSTYSAGYAMDTYYYRG